MESGQSQNGCNDANEGHVNVHRIWELTKIGNFDVDSWKIILSNLKDTELATVALVCKDLQLIAEHIFDSRYNRKRVGGAYLVIGVSFTNTNWKPVICRFRHKISEVMVVGPPATEVVRQEDFAYFQHFLGQTVKKITFDGFVAKQWKDVVNRRAFEKVEELAFIRSDLTKRCSLLHNFWYWYPNLKSLIISSVVIGRNTFIEQSIPSVERVNFHQVKSVSSDYLLVFIIKNPQLKNLMVDSNDFPLATNMACMPIVNEVLTNLETLMWGFSDMSLLPTFRQNFVNLKKLNCTFVSNQSSYKNELLKIIGYFPVLEVLKVTLIPKLLMTNDDLIDLLTHGSSTLKNLEFSSRSMCTKHIELKVGYDLHRGICEATANRSEVLIDINFIFVYFHLLISKEWIKKNGQYIVVKDSMSDSVDNVG